jgi:hypothetical protein
LKFFAKIQLFELPTKKKEWIKLLKKKRLLRDSHQGATLTQTQNKTRQNYYANLHPLYNVYTNAEHGYSHIHAPLRVSCNNKTMLLQKMFWVFVLKKHNNAASF